MAKLERKKFKVFGENAPLDEIGQFGSAKATTKKNTKDIEEIQELDAWSEGWGGAVISNKNYPPMEEMTGAMNVMSYQTAYTLQEGIPEWNKDTTYYKGSIVKNLEGEDVKLYQSISNDNLNNPLSNTDNWSKISFGSGLEVCDIGMALYVDETKGLRRYLNGQIVDINTNTQAFLNRLKDITTLHPSLLCTEEEWQTAKTMSVFSQVGKFVFNYADDGVTVVSVRIPRVVNVQGLFDLQNLGLTVAESLPNIKGTLGAYTYHITEYTGSFLLKDMSSWNNFANGTGIGRSSSYSFDASRSSSTYQDGAPVQQEAIQYPYFIQIATGSETENNIVNEIELNNPFSLLDYKYSEYELNNISWLRSEGQYNSKAVYPSVYDLLLKIYNGTETKAGVSVKLSTETYTDYDFVLSTAEETFRFPLKTKLASGKAVVGNGMTLGFTNGTDYLGISQANSQSINYSVSGGTDVYGKPVGTVATVVDVTKVAVSFGITTDPTKSGIETSDSGLYLYYYVGETVQNANLIDAGRVGEQLANKVDTTNTQWATNACMPDYSAGISANGLYTSTNKFVAPCAGVLIYFAWCATNSLTLYVNDTPISNGYGSGQGYGMGYPITLFLNKGDTYYQSSATSDRQNSDCAFYPLKGAN